MTPPVATTAAAKSKPTRRSPGNTAAQKGSSKRQARPSAPARVVRSTSASAKRPLHLRRTARGAEARPTSRHRRTSGPAAPGRAAARLTSAAPLGLAPRLRALPQLRPLPVLGTIGAHAFRVGRTLPDSRLLDRLLRARAWVLLLGVLLFGLVAMNVSLLKLNAESGRSAEKARALAIRNTQLQAKVSRLASGEHLQAAARKLGFSMPSPDRVQYLTARRGDGARAAKTILSQAPLTTTPSLTAVPSAAVGSGAAALADDSGAEASPQPAPQAATGAGEAVQSPATGQAAPDAAAQVDPTATGQMAPTGGGEAAPIAGGQTAPIAGDQPASQGGSGQQQGGQGG